MTTKLCGAIAAGLLMLGTATVGLAADKDADAASATVTTVFVDGKAQNGFAEKVNKTDPRRDGGQGLEVRGFRALQ